MREAENGGSCDMMWWCGNVCACVHGLGSTSMGGVDGKCTAVQLLWRANVWPHFWIRSDGRIDFCDLDDIVPPRWCSSIAVSGRNCAFLKQTHKFAHCIRDNQLCIPFNKDIEFGILISLRLLACAIVASFCGD